MSALLHSWVLSRKDVRAVLLELVRSLALIQHHTSVQLFL